MIALDVRNRVTPNLVKLLLVLLLGASVFVQCAWAHPEEEPMVVTIWAGQHIESGEIQTWNDDDYIYVKYVAYPDWTISETHLEVRSVLVDIPQNKGGPIPGQFTYKDEWDPRVAEVEYKVPMTFEPGTLVYVAAHAVMVSPTQGSETGWGGDQEFPGKNWALYYTYTVQKNGDVEYEAYVGYEDRWGGDFDYNDFGMNMELKETYEDNKLTTLMMRFKSLYKKAGDLHNIHMFRKFPAGTGYDYSVARSSPAQGTEMAVGNYAGANDFDVILYDTKYFQPNVIVTITITITSGEVLYDPDQVAPRWDLDPFLMHYDPWMQDKSFTGPYPFPWNIIDWQPAGAYLPTQGYDVPFILIVPYLNWPAPGEAVPTTTPYPDFDDWYNTRNPTYSEWYLP